jgi:hypothetical protein
MKLLLRDTAQAQVDDIKCSTVTSVNDAISTSAVQKLEAGSTGTSAIFAVSTNAEDSIITMEKGTLNSGITSILPVVKRGCEPGPFTFWEEYTRILQVSANKGQGKVCGPKTDEEIGTSRRNI